LWNTSGLACVQQSCPSGLWVDRLARDGVLQCREHCQRMRTRGSTAADAPSDNKCVVGWRRDSTRTGPVKKTVNLSVLGSKMRRNAIPECWQWIEKQVPEALTPPIASLCCVVSNGEFRPENSGLRKFTDAKMPCCCLGKLNPHQGHN
jgi:hypothetical protein